MRNTQAVQVLSATFLKTAQAPLQLKASPSPPERSLDGRTHAELQHVLRVRVHNTLLDLVREGRIGQAHFGAVHLYVSADPALAAEQLARRQELAHVLEEALRTLSTEETIEVLAEALRAASGIPDAATVAARLAARGRAH